MDLFFFSFFSNFYKSVVIWFEGFILRHRYFNLKLFITKAIFIWIIMVYLCYLCGSLWINWFVCVVQFCDIHLLKNYVQNEKMKKNRSGETQAHLYANKCTWLPPSISIITTTKQVNHKNQFKVKLVNFKLKLKWVDIARPAPLIWNTKRWCERFSGYIDGNIKQNT